MDDERLKTFLADHQEVLEDVSAMLNCEEERLPKDTHGGLLNEAIEKSGEAIPLPRRRFLQLGSLAIALLLPPGRKAKIALETAGSLGGAASIYAVKEGWADKRKAEWEVSEAFTAKLSRMSYNDPRIDSLLEGGAARNRGELALLRSFILHRDRQFELLIRNADDLRKAFDQSDSPNARSLIIGRIAIDYNAMGAGRDAVESLDLLDTNRVTDHNILVQCLDYAASIRLNNLASKDFRSFEISRLGNLVQDWKVIGIDLERGDGTDEIARQYGLHAFTVILLRKIIQVSKGSDESQIQAIRKDWVDETLQLAESYRDSAESSAFAEDAFYSLHRPAFHAFLNNDDEGANAICDYYFGRSKKSEGEHMIAARKNILRKLGPGVQWMYLLDAARFVREGKIDAAREQLNILGENANMHLNYVVMKVSPFVFKKCGLTIESKIDAISQKRSRVPEVSLMRSYAEAVSG